MRFIEQKNPQFLRNNKTNIFLKNSDWCVLPSYLSRRYQCLIDNDKILFSSRMSNDVFDNYKVNKKVPSIKEQIEELCLPNGTLLLGEFYYEDFNLMTKMIVTETQESLLLQRKYELLYIINDIAFFDNFDLRKKTFLERRQVLEDIFDDCNLNRIKLVECYYDTIGKKAFYKEAEKNSKSVVFINSSLNYDQHKAFRYNHPNTYYAVILDVNIKNSMAYSISLGMYNQNSLFEVGNATGLSYQQSIQLAKNKEQFIGKIVKVSARQKCKSKLKNSKLLEICIDEDIKKCQW